VNYLTIDALSGLNGMAENAVNFFEKGEITATLPALL
jgi:hypothetical protein